MFRLMLRNRDACDDVGSTTLETTATEHRLQRIEAATRDYRFTCPDSENTNSAGLEQNRPCLISAARYSLNIKHILVLLSKAIYTLGFQSFKWLVNSFGRVNLLITFRNLKSRL